MPPEQSDFPMADKGSAVIECGAGSASASPLLTATRGGARIMAKQPPAVRRYAAYLAYAALLVGALWFGVAREQHGGGGGGLALAEDDD